MMKMGKMGKIEKIWKIGKKLLLVQEFSCPPIFASPIFASPPPRVFASPLLNGSQPRYLKLKITPCGFAESSHPDNISPSIFNARE